MIATARDRNVQAQRVPDFSIKTPVSSADKFERSNLFGLPMTRARFNPLEGHPWLHKEFDRVPN